MLNTMENETELFRAWLRKYVKEDRKITGVELASKLGIENSARISYYHSGRVVNGHRTYPRIPFKIKNKIVEIVGIPYQQILNEGRKILSPTHIHAPAPTPAPDTEIRKFVEMVQSQKKIIENQDLQITELRQLKDRLLQEIDDLKNQLSGQSRSGDTGASPDQCQTCPVKLRACH